MMLKIIKKYSYILFSNDLRLIIYKINVIKTVFYKIISVLH